MQRKLEHTGYDIENGDTQDQETIHNAKNHKSEAGVLEEQVCHEGVNLSTLP